MPTLQIEMQASSALNFRYFTCLLDKGHIKLGGFSVSISEGPGGHSLQVCSLGYKNTVVAPEGFQSPDSPQALGNPEDNQK